MNERTEKAKRDFYTLLQKNKERGLLSKSLINRLKKLGFDMSDKYVPPSEAKKKKKKQGQMRVDRFHVFKQRQRGKGYDETDWMPKSTINHTDDFFEWINSMTFGSFPDKIDYLPFEKYKAQAQYFMETSRNPYETTNVDLKMEMVLEEYRRINQNTLYFSMKYGKVKEGSVAAGKIDYVPKEHNAVIFYLLDCGYSFIFGKPRQIFATTTVGMYIMKKLLTQENFYMKFITQDIETGMEIFADKLKVPYGYLPRWLSPQAARDYNRGFQLGRKVAKGEFAPPNSRIEVVAPSKTAINGGSPQIVLVDEIGNVPNLIPMILEAMPTMYIDPNQDGNLQLVRQIALWGTGVSDNQGKDAFKTLWTNIVENWEKKKFTSSIFVPIFFSWHTRCSADIYEDARAMYYTGGIGNTQNFSSEEQKQIFHMHYPSVWSDMFAMASNKLVSRKLIEENLSRIRNYTVDQKPIYGWFEPIYDYTREYDDNIGVPFRIIGAKFVPYDDKDENIDKISTIMRHKPVKDWINRYYMGTDPIATETGLSNFASAIWDDEDKTVSCIVNFRKSQDHKSAFVQALLMSIYYDVNRELGQKIGVPELIENNIGTNYKDYKDLLDYGNNLVYNKELPPDLQGGGAYWGVNSKAKRKEIIVAHLSEMVTTYCANFDFDIIFKQLDTYVPTVREGGTTWQPVDRRLYRDDVLDAIAYAYICRKAHDGVKPEYLGSSGEHIEYMTVWKDHRLSDGTLTRIPEKIRK
jgi:hypothetical protein